jgi:DNA ligase-associated metallophosphoesterase
MRAMRDAGAGAVGETLPILLAGEPVVLLADRALYWPARGRLLIADLHLGKGDVFRAAGIPVPTGGTAHDLARLDVLLRATGAHALWILGDFLHGPRHAGVDAAWRALRDAHPHVHMAVVRGNHDRRFDRDAAGVEEVPDGLVDGPFAFRHAPHDEPPAGATGDAPHLLCGHVHPVLRIPGTGAHPLFWLQPGCTVLPAFSRFTGGYRVSPAACAGSVVCDGRALLRLP